MKAKEEPRMADKGFFVRVTVYVSEEERRCIRAQVGKRGLASKAEAREWCADAIRSDLSMIDDGDGGGPGLD